MGKRQAKIFIITKKKKNCIKSKGDFLSYSSKHIRKGIYQRRDKKRKQTKCEVSSV